MERNRFWPDQNRAGTASRSPIRSGLARPPLLYYILFYYIYIYILTHSIATSCLFLVEQLVVNKALSCPGRSLGSTCQFEGCYSKAIGEIQEQLSLGFFHVPFSVSPWSVFLPSSFSHLKFGLQLEGCGAHKINLIHQSPGSVQGLHHSVGRGEIIGYQLAIWE